MHITFNNISKQYTSKKALDGVSFDIQERSCIALVGNNGSGKTTTINVLCNLIPFEGNLIINGNKITSSDHSYKSEIGVFLSDPFYLEEFSCAEYWKFSCVFQGITDQEEIAKRIEDLSVLLGLEDKRKTIHNLSSGERVKVSIGAALIHNPKLLILDEPFIHLDADSRNRIVSILKDLKATKSILLASHNLSICTDICDQFIILDQGKIIENISKNEVSEYDSLNGFISKRLLKNYGTHKFEWLE